MVTEPTGTGATVIAAVPDLPPLVPVICAVPVVTAVTVAVRGPVDETVATPGVLLVNVTVAPGIGLPLLSVTSAVNVTVCPTCRLDDCGEIATALVGTGCTVSVVVADTPSLVAEIVTEPAFLPVAMPFGAMLAVVVSDEAHVMTRPFRGLPAESSGVATSCVVSPAMTDGLVGAITIFETGTAVTVSAAFARAAPDATVIVAEPDFFAR